MRRLAPLMLLVFLVSCGTEPAFVPRRDDPAWHSIDAACMRFPDWSDGLSLEELLVCVELRGPARLAREYAELARAQKGETSTFASLPFELSAVPASRREDRTASGAIVSHVFDFNGRWEKRQATLTATIVRAGSDADDVLSRARDRARRAYWSAVAAERRLAIAREGAIAFSRVGPPDCLSSPDSSIARAAHDRADVGVRIAEHQSALAREEVEVLVGGEAPTDWTLADSLPEDGAEVDLSRAIVLAGEHSARLASLDAAAAEARCRLDQFEAEAALDPGVGVGYSIQRDTNSTRIDLHDADSTTFFGLTLTLPASARSRRMIAAAFGEARTSLHERLAAEADIAPEVTEAVGRYREARAKMARIELSVPSAPRPGAMGAWVREEVGLLEAKRFSVEAQLEFAIARSRLEAAVGRPVAEYAR